MAQVFISPSKDFFTSKVQSYFIGQYRIGEDGLYHYYDMEGHINSSSGYDQYIEGLEHFYCYDKKTNTFFFYTDNTLGYYNPTLPSNIKLLTNYMKNGGVRNVKENELLSLTRDILKEMDENFISKNDSIAELLRIKREKFINDSIEAAKRKMVEREEYRKTHNWRDLSMSKKYSLKCDFCGINHYLKDYKVMFISSDTLYYFLDKPDVSYLGINHIGVHYSKLSNDFKKDNRFKEYVDIWSDSIANNNKFSNLSADIINIIQYNEFKEKVYSVAPNGFIKNWGWKLNSAQGIEPNFTFFNSSKKTIKYVDLYFSLYNAVGDRCLLRFEGSYIGNVRGVGPVEPFEDGSWDWKRATHYTSADASEMRIVKLVITYMDGTTKTIPKDSIIYDN